jgi:hypothetical protein
MLATDQLQTTSAPPTKHADETTTVSNSDLPPPLAAAAAAPVVVSLSDPILESLVTKLAASTGRSKSESRLGPIIDGCCSCSGNLKGEFSTSGEGMG